MSDIEIKNLNLELQGKTIISGLNIILRKSEIHSVVGLSGAGKTQLLRTIAGLNRFATSLNLEKESRIVFQENNLIPWLSLKKNVQITTKASSYAIDEMFELLDLAKYKEYMPYQVSGGMQQRVSLIRALIDKCDILLLDEPYSRLDPVNKKINYEVLLKLWKKNQPTILMVTHDLDEAIYFSQRISYFSKTERKIIYTKSLSFSYPRSASDIRKTREYEEVYEKFNELLQEDFKHANLE